MVAVQVSIDKTAKSTYRKKVRIVKIAQQFGGKMTSFIGAIRRFYETVWSETPWLKSAGIVGAAGTGLAYLNTQLPKDISVDFATPGLAQIALVGIVLLYFFLVAVFSGDRLRFERKLRKLEQSYRYDNRGTLYNGTQPNIAFRVTTFKGILGGIAGAIGEDELQRALTNTGRLASHDFATNLPSIYNQDVAAKGGGEKWDDLSFAQKVHKWAEYDSATGWGILTGKVDSPKVKVSITHLQGLFQDTGGLMFAYFLAGYCETVLTEIVKGHANGKFDEYTRAELLETNTKSNRTVEIEFVLR